MAGSTFATTTDFNAAVKAIEVVDGLIVDGLFTGAVPTDANQFAISCTLRKTDAAGATSGLYTNQGSVAVPSFVEL